MLSYRETIKLDNKSISQVVTALVDTYTGLAKKRAANTTKLDLSVEDILLYYQDAYGMEAECTVAEYKSFGKIVIEFHCRGAQINPLPSNDQEDVSLSILSRLDVIPKYSYKSGTSDNVVTLTAEQKPRKNQMLISILVAVVLAMVVHVLMGLLPEATQTSLAADVIAPLFNKSMAIITTVATPLVFFGILNGIVEIGDVRSLGAIGKVFLSNMGKTYLFAGAACSVLAALVYGIALNPDSAAGGGYVAQAIKLVLDIIPDHVLEPFSIDNDLQVVTVAVLIGVAILKMSSESESVKNALNTIGDIVNQMMMIVLKILPFIIFIGILNILCTKMGGLGKLYLMIVLFIISTAIELSYMLIRTKRAIDVPIKDLFKMQLPTTMINLTTSSQVSALPENIICCRDKFGIDEKLVNFGLPLGIVVYMPNGACFFILTVWSLASLAGASIGIFQLIVTMFIAIIVAIAAPPIPGSAITVLPIMMSVCNVPNEYFPIAVLLATVLGYFLPLFNGYSLQLELLLTAKKLQMINTHK